MDIKLDHGWGSAVGRLRLQPLGEVCLGEECRSPDGVLRGPDDDAELQLVLGKLREQDLASGFTTAIRASIDYVLDGARTGRFDLLSKDVHPGERASVGAKLEYEAQRVFKWAKAKPLDIEIADVPVDLKSTVGDNWAIPTEAHCHLCICTQMRLKDNVHKSWLIRTHTSWLYRGKGNKDGKRGIAVDARHQWGVPLYDWTPLPVNPLTLLTKHQKDQVFDPGRGQEVRLLRLFNYLPMTVIERSVVLTVCANRQDPMRRARAIKDEAAKQGILLLCGKWISDRAVAKTHGYDLGPGDWVAIPNGSNQVEPPGEGFLF